MYVKVRGGGAVIRTVYAGIPETYWTIPARYAFREGGVAYRVRGHVSVCEFTEAERKGLPAGELLFSVYWTEYRRNPDLLHIIPLWGGDQFPFVRWMDEEDKRIAEDDDPFARTLDVG